MTKKRVFSRREWVVAAIVLGIFLRFFCMSLGHNFDFESYQIVGDLVSRLQSVYAHTARYNYGPLFFCIQGLCYKFSTLFPSQSTDWVYRVLLVSVLTAGDLGITDYIWRHHGVKPALLFFLNPVSVHITGYHNQFDNLAILLMLLAVDNYNDSEKWTKKDTMFIVFYALSLMMKHDMAFFALWILFRHGLQWKKKLVYTFLPPVLFLLSFVPFVIGNPAAYQGVMNNVFFYRSMNNAPLLIRLYQAIGLPAEKYLYAFVIIMAVIGFMARKFPFEKNVLVYMISLVAFTSGMGDQYLAIPMAALAVLCAGGYWLYISYSYTVILLIPMLGLNDAVLRVFPFLKQVVGWDSPFGYFGSCLILVLCLIEIFTHESDRKTKTEKWTGIISVCAACVIITTGVASSAWAAEHTNVVTSLDQVPDKYWEEVSTKNGKLTAKTQLPYRFGSDGEYSYRVLGAGTYEASAETFDSKAASDASDKVYVLDVPDEYWKQAAAETESFSGMGIYRFGTDDRWNYAVVKDGTYTAENGGLFGPDPAVNTPKAVYRLVLTR